MYGIAKCLACAFAYKEVNICMHAKAGWYAPQKQMSLKHKLLMGSASANNRLHFPLKHGQVKLQHAWTYISGLASNPFCIEDTLPRAVSILITNKYAQGQTIQAKSSSMLACSCLQTV